MQRSLSLLIVILAASFAFAADDVPATAPPAVQRAMKSFDARALAVHDKFLASDLLEGRGPGTRGDDLAMEYIASQFELFGLQPAGDHGTYYQRVPLVGSRTVPEKSSISFVKEGAPAITPKYGDDFVTGDQTQKESNDLDSELVFVGHGVQAPEYKWDDYKGLDTRGKTLVMLVDDPPATPAEPDLFKGKTRTYYGRWTYKYEIGTAKGAQGVILIHTDDAAGYGWGVVRNSWGGEKSYLEVKPGAPALRFAAWVSEQLASQLFKGAGLDLNAMTKAAASRDFKPVPLGYRLSGKIVSAVRKFDSANVIARLPGSDPAHRDEGVLYSAHHDHFGIGKADPKGDPNDTIYNGAIDNASGCALLIDSAHVWATSGVKPKRSIYFAAVAAEEQGLLGSEWLAENPPLPTGKIALGINYDAIPELGRVRDVSMIGIERQTFFADAQRIAKAMGIRIVPDLEPEQGHYYRSDHFNLAKAGVPAFSVDPGHDIVGKPAGWGKKMSDDYREHRYHEPSDQFDPKWDWTEGVEIAQLGFWLGWDAANSATMPNWVPGDEFRAIRDKALKAAKK
jgi:Zn-dependent M28 family amino/carboxypeptidase